MESYCSVIADWRPRQRLGLPELNRGHVNLYDSLFHDDIVMSLKNKHKTFLAMSS